jgi:type VI secretion system protein ImpH
MPATLRRIHLGLIQRLREEPYRFEFFQAVRLLLIEQRKRGKLPDRDVLGQVIRFRNSVSLAFPPSEIEALEFEKGDHEDNDEAAFERVTLTPAFIGLTGPLGVMPRHYTQYVAERETYHRDQATRAFLDIFTSRAVAVFYQSWLKYRLHLQYEEDRNQRFLPLTLGLAGIDADSLRNQSPLPDDLSRETLAYYAGLLRQRPQSAQWFSRLVADHFGVRCRVEQFVGRWIDLPTEELTRLGDAHCSLGIETFCGGRYWNRQSRVRLTIGPLKKKQFEDFLPKGKAGKKLGFLFRLMVGMTQDCEVRLQLDRKEIEPSALGNERAGIQLGWLGWLASMPISSDAKDTAYLINSETTS